MVPPGQTNARTDSTVEESFSAVGSLVVSRPHEYVVAVGVNPCSSLPSSPVTTDDYRACFRQSVLPWLEVCERVNPSDCSLVVMLHSTRS